MNEQKEKLLCEIGMLDFICIEMNLYLDTHPKDMDAIAYYKYYNRLYKQAKREYSVKYGPLCPDDTDIPGGTDYWKWSTEPFPFQ